MQLKKFVNQLASEYKDITSIWLFGSRANGCHEPDSDWDLFVFGSEEVLNQLKSKPNFYHSDIDLLVVTDGNHFIEPWPGNKPKQDSLSNWQWKELTCSEAQYISAKEPIDGSAWYRSETMVQKAIRLWPN